VIVTRDASAADNPSLLALAAACPMVGHVTLSVERDPDFFALNRLSGDSWRVGVAMTAELGISGCVAVAERRTYLFGRPVMTAYASDLKVLPAARGGGSAPALLRWAREAVRAYGGDEMPCLLTILGGNRPMERLARGRPGLPIMDRFATIRVHSVPLLLRRRPEDGGLRIAPAEPCHVEAMVALWEQVAPHRQFAPVLDADGFAAWVASAPGLGFHDYWLAWRRDGRLAGFVGIWEQSALKRMRVLAYSRRLAAVRLAINVIGRLTGGATFPPAGAPLRTATAVHVCVPSSEPGVLHALLLRIHDALRARRFAVFAVGLDPRDGLSAAVRGLMSQPTDVNACITTAGGRYTGVALNERPLYYDIALV